MDEGILRLIEGMEGVIDCRAYTFVDSREGTTITITITPPSNIILYNVHYIATTHILPFFFTYLTISSYLFVSYNVTSQQLQQQQHRHNNNNNQ